VIGQQRADQSKLGFVETEDAIAMAVHHINIMGNLQHGPTLLALHSFKV